MDGGTRAPGRVAKLVAIIFRDIIAVAFIGTHLVLRDLMAGSRKRPLPSWTLPRGPRRNLPKRARALRLAWVLFIFIGVPLGFMVALGPLAYAGIYIEPLRQFWQPWPPDIVKGIGGVLGFAATLGYLMYRKGRYTGYRSGAVSERATARNRSEGRVTVVNPAASAETALNPPPPPEIAP